MSLVLVFIAGLLFAFGGLPGCILGAVLCVVALG